MRGGVERGGERGVGGSVSYAVRGREYMREGGSMRGCVTGYLREGVRLA